MLEFVRIMGIFVILGMVQDLVSYGPRLSFFFFISKVDFKRYLFLTLNGQPLTNKKRKSELLLIENQFEKKKQDKTQKQENYIVAIIPAWNEERDIPKTIKSILNQTRKPDKIIVIPNNTTDMTAEVSRHAGAQVLVMPGYNPDKKAGALNYGLNQLASELNEHEEVAILVMDADTIVSNDFIEVASEVLFSDKKIGGVGSIFTGRQSRTLLGTMQQMEYGRYGYHVRKRPEAFVLSGTASLFRWDAFKAVKDARLSGELGGGKGYYDTTSLTEDNEITFAILKLGYFCPTCNVESVTDVMEDITSLYKQRKRWYVGALQNIQAYGREMPIWMRYTYWRQQIGLSLSLVLMPMMAVGFYAWALTGFSERTTPAIILDLLITPIYIGVKIYTVRHLGKRAILAAALFIPEILYSNLLVIIFALSLITFFSGKDNGEWVHT